MDAPMAMQRPAKIPFAIRGDRRVPVPRLQGHHGFLAQWRLVNGVMNPHAHLGNGFTTDLAPTRFAIWLNNTNGTLHQQQISVDTSDSNTPTGHHYFADQTGDIYGLSAPTPMLHTLRCNCAQPAVVDILIDPAYGPPGDWSNAPACIIMPETG